MEDDMKLRREIHAALAMHALLLVDGDDTLSSTGDERSRKLAAKAEAAAEIADAMIAELGPIA